MFMEKVLSDKNFTRYRAKFPKEPSQQISRAYKCPSYVPPEIIEADDLADPAKTEDVAEEVPKPETTEVEEKAAER